MDDIGMKNKNKKNKKNAEQAKSKQVLELAIMAS